MEVFFMNEDIQNPTQNSNGFVKSLAKWAALGFAVLAIGMLFLPLIEQCVKNELGEKVYTLIFLWDVFAIQPVMINVVAIIALLVIAIPLILLSDFNESFAVGAAMASLIAGALMIVVPSIYLGEVGCRSADINAGLVFGFAASIASAVFSLTYSYKKMPMSVRDIAEDAILVAAAFALNFVKIPLGATGGSINFQMLPLFIIALRHGPFHGLISGGIVFGVLTCFTDGYGFATFPFDYLIGFGSVAVLGFFRSLIMGEDKAGYNLMGEIFLAVGTLLAGLVRFAGSTISSMAIYGYEFVPALAYNVTYIPASVGVALVALMVLYGPLLKLDKMFPTGNRNAD